MNRKRMLESMTKPELVKLLDETALSEEERVIMEMLYIRRRPLRYVADVMAYSESGMKKKHDRILKRIKT